MKNWNFKLNCFILLISLFSCTSSAILNENNLTGAEYFQKAYEATDKNNFTLAIRYYKAFQKDFPGDVERNLWAEYEIAFAYYKMGNTAKALELFNVLIDKYKVPENAQWTTAPKMLAERVIAKIQEQKK